METFLIKKSLISKDFLHVFFLVMLIYLSFLMIPLKKKMVGATIVIKWTNSLKCYMQGQREGGLGEPWLPWLLLFYPLSLSLSLSLIYIYNNNLPIKFN